MTWHWSAKKPGLDSRFTSRPLLRQSGRPRRPQTKTLSCGKVHLRTAPPLVSSLTVAAAKRESSSKWKILMFNQLLMSEILLLHESFPVNYFLAAAFSALFLTFLLRRLEHSKSSPKEAKIKTDIPEKLWWGKFNSVDDTVLHLGIIITRFWRWLEINGNLMT